MLFQSPVWKEIPELITAVTLVNWLKLSAAMQASTLNYFSWPLLPPRKFVPEQVG